MIRWAVIAGLLVTGCAVPDFTDKDVLHGDTSFDASERTAIETASEDWCQTGGDCMEVVWDCQSPCEPTFGNRMVINGGVKPAKNVPGTWWIWIAVPSHRSDVVYRDMMHSLANREDS